MLFDHTHVVVAFLMICSNNDKCTVPISLTRQPAIDLSHTLNCDVLYQLCTSFYGATDCVFHGSRSNGIAQVI